MMACEICGRGSCTRSFHSLEEQEEFDTKTGRYASSEPTDAAMSDSHIDKKQPQCRDCPIATLERALRNVRD
jgi:hypothetical protein